MPEEPLNNQGSEESKKPNPTTQEANAGEDTNTEANNLANEILQQFKFKQTQTSKNENEGSATASVVSVGFSRASSDVPLTRVGPTDVPMDVSPTCVGLTNAGTNANPTLNTSSSSGTTRVVDCRPCGGCCGRVSGVRLGVEDYVFIVRAAKELGMRECDVVNWVCSLGEVLLRGNRSSRGSLKEDERFVSREGIYKPGYLIVRLRDADVEDAWFFVASALYEEYKLNERERYYRGEVDMLRIPGKRGFVKHPFITGFIRDLGFESLDELSRYLKAVVDGLVLIDAVTKDDKKRRRVSMDEVRSVICRICGVEIPALGRPSKFIRSMVEHFRGVHGLMTVADVEAKAHELDKAQFRDFLPIDPRLLGLELSMSASVIVSLAGRLNLVGFTEDGYVCRLCSRKFASELELTEHLIHDHYAELTGQNNTGLP